MDLSQVLVLYGQGFFNQLFQVLVYVFVFDWVQVVDIIGEFYFFFFGEFDVCWQLLVVVGLIVVFNVFFKYRFLNVCLGMGFDLFGDNNIFVSLFINGIFYFDDFVFEEM